MRLHPVSLCVSASLRELNLAAAERSRDKSPCGFAVDYRSCAALSVFAKLGGFCMMAGFGGEGAFGAVRAG